MRIFAVATLALYFTAAGAADLSPSAWPVAERLAAEQQEFAGPSPAAAQVRNSTRGVVSATLSPISVEAGLVALRHGGNAADAAATVALTQVTTQLGSVVSYAGIMTMLYYDAKTGKVWSLDAGYGTYRGETDAKSIPPSDISALTGGPPPQITSDFGRQTLVPGFMAGMEAMQKRFGRLTFADTLAPAIWYAKNGMKVSPLLSYFFKFRAKELARTEEGRRFLHQGGDDLPKVGDIFHQADLAATLRAVARHGARTMYTGRWAKDFVAIVRHEGGKVTAADLASYRPVWSDAASATVFGHTVYTNGGDSFAPYQLLTALKAAEAMKLQERGSYWSDQDTFLALNRLGQVVAGAPVLHPAVAQAMAARGIDISPAGQRSDTYAQALAQLLPSLFASNNGDTHHSNALVVVDKDGNIAVMTHTINSVIWGDTGIVVGGIPIPDSAGFQQLRLAMLKPGDRLPNEIPDALVLDAKGRPVLASAVVGSSILPETLRLIVSCIGQHQPLATVAAEPPLLISVDPKSFTVPLGQRPIVVPAGAYEAVFRDALKSSGVTLAEMPATAVAGVRGTLAVVELDPDTGARRAPETPGVMVFTGTE